jgi:hypothetical protein
MPALRELQAAFLHAMFGPDGPELLETIVGDGLLPAARLDLSSPRVDVTDRRLAGDFPSHLPSGGRTVFRYAADAYIRQHPPAARACLSMARTFRPSWRPFRRVATSRTWRT